MSVTTSNRKAPDVLRAELVKMSGEFASALPSHITVDKFQRVVMTVVQQSPDLLAADRKTLLASCMKCAADGLVPDGREAALVLFGGKVQYMPMTFGLLKRIRNSGQVASVAANVIYQNDHFVWRQGLDSAIEHIPLFPGDRGKPIGAYAVARFKDDDDPIFEVMDLAQIEKVRKVSRAANAGPWRDWWDEMARKTVARRLSKWLPMDASRDGDIQPLPREDEDHDVVDETTGVVIEPDEFERASRGEVKEITSQNTIEGEAPEIQEEDPNRTAAQDAAAEIMAEIAKADDVDALIANVAVKKRMERLEKNYPDLHAQIVNQINVKKLA